MSPALCSKDAPLTHGISKQSGKLPLTFPRRLKDNPTYFNFRSEGGRVLYGEDVYVGYRYYEGLDIDPLFPFGHGLSYTKFELSDLQLTKDPEGLVHVSCKARNAGPRAGAEVVQVYVSPVAPPIKRPLKELKEFCKIRVESGAEEVVTIPLDMIRVTSFWDEKTNSWCSHSGTYNIMVGTSSQGEFLEKSLEISETSFWSGSWDRKI